MDMISEPVLLHNIMERYSKDLIYVRSCHVLPVTLPDLHWSRCHFREPFSSSFTVRGTPHPGLPTKTQGATPPSFVLIGTRSLQKSSAGKISVSDYQRRKWSRKNGGTLPLAMLAFW